MTNAELLDAANLTDDVWTKEKALKWTEERLGIQTRHIARDKSNFPSFTTPPGAENSSLCANAIRKAVENSGYDLSDIGEVPFVESRCPLIVARSRSHYRIYSYS